MLNETVRNMDSGLLEVWDFILLFFTTSLFTVIKR